MNILSGIGEIERCLADARREVSPLLARRHYLRVVEWAKTRLEEQLSLDKVVELGSSALSDLATMESDAQKRLAFRHEAVELCRQGMKIEFAPRMATSFANRIVDLFYDRSVSKEHVRIPSLLANALQALDRGMNLSQDRFVQAQLLAQKSSVLRCQGLLSYGQDRIARGSEAIRSAKKAFEFAPGASFAYLELGQSFWSAARWATSDDRYVSALNGAEHSLIRAQSGGESLPKLVLSRFYRLTYRPAKAIDVFSEYAALERNTRRKWAESYIYGEAAIQLWYNEYEESLVSRSLTQARDMLREAVDAGYENARHYSILAHVEAALGDVEIANRTLNNIALKGPPSWISAIQELMSSGWEDNTKPIEKAWVVGITDAPVWNSLGTYSVNFLNDRELAVQLYEYARRIDPKSPVVLTNLARLLIERGQPEDFALADRYLQQAACYADRGFYWWRDVRRQLDKVRGVKRRLKPPKRRFGDNRVTRKELQIKLRKLDNWRGNPSERGRMFENLFVDLLRMTAGVSHISPSYQLPRQGSADYSRERQVDAAFRYSGVHYRVELKWESKPVGPSKITDFFARLRTPGISGLFVSMSGFTKGAVDQAWELVEKDQARVILLDGNELRSVISGTSSFETILENKERYLSLIGKPYVSLAA